MMIHRDQADYNGGAEERPGQDESAPVWGFDYNFTSYMLKKQNMISKNIEFHPSGQMLLFLFI